MKTFAVMMLLSGPVFAASPAEVIFEPIRTASPTIPLEGIAWLGAPASPPYRLDFGTAATNGQKNSAGNIAATVDVSAAALAAFDVARERKAAASFQNSTDPAARFLTAIVIWQAGKLGITPAQARTEIKAILDAN